MSWIDCRGIFARSERTKRKGCREFIQFQQVSVVSTKCSTIFMLLTNRDCMGAGMRIQNIESRRFDSLHSRNANPFEILMIQIIENDNK